MLGRMNRSRDDKVGTRHPRGQGKSPKRRQYAPPSSQEQRDKSSSLAVRHGKRALATQRDFSDRFLIQFNSGLGELVERSLAIDLGPARIDYRDGSALVIRLETSPDKVASLPYVRNTFVVLGEVPEDNPARAADRAAKTFDTFLSAPKSMMTIPHFRVMAQHAGQLVSIPAPSRARLEQAITRIDGGMVQARGSGREYWLIGRRNSESTILAMKIPKAKTKRKPAAGEIAPELAALLARASRPASHDVVLDPFAGTGSLLRARAALPHSQLIANDLHRTISHPEASIRLLRQDGRELSAIKDGSIDAVITDPPWGEFDEIDEPMDLFVDHSVATIRRVLHPYHGRAVLMIARQIERIWVASLESHELEVTSITGILVNGHPASVITAHPHSSR